MMSWQRSLARRHPTGLFIGAEETILSVTLAVNRTELAGVDTKVYPKNGHLMSIESGRNQISMDVTSFLVDGNAR